MLLAKEVLVRAAPKAKVKDVLGTQFKPVPAKEGEKLTIFTPEYIDIASIAGITHTLVDAIERKRVTESFQAAIDAAANRSPSPGIDP